MKNGTYIKEEIISGKDNEIRVGAKISAYASLPMVAAPQEGALRPERSEVERHA